MSVKWLIDSSHSSATVRVTRQQAKGQLDSDQTDQTALVAASGAQLHLMEDIFNFSDELFEDYPVHATSPSAECNYLSLSSIPESN